MNKKTLNKIIKTLNRVIDLEPQPVVESDILVASAPVDHDLNHEKVVEIAMRNSNWTEYELLKYILTPIINNNQENYDRLFVMYELMARAAKLEDRNEYYNLHKLAYKALAARQLQGIASPDEQEYYIQVVNHRSCCELCCHLHETYYNSRDFVLNPPLPIQNCTRPDGMCSCFLIAMSERRYKRLTASI